MIKFDIYFEISIKKQPFLQLRLWHHLIPQTWARPVPIMHLCFSMRLEKNRKTGRNVHKWMNVVFFFFLIYWYRCNGYLNRRDNQTKIWNWFQLLAWSVKAKLFVFLQKWLLTGMKTKWLTGRVCVLLSKYKREVIVMF